MNEKQKPLIVYVAGPFRAADTWKLRQNIRAAERVAYEVAAAGHVPICPHTLYGNFDRTLSDEFWIDATLQLLELCDCAIFLPDWRKSEGSQGEWAHAEKLGIPFETIKGDGLSMAGIMAAFSVRTAKPSMLHDNINEWKRRVEELIDQRQQLERGNDALNKALEAATKERHEQHTEIYELRQQLKTSQQRVTNLDAIGECCEQQAAMVEQLRVQLAGCGVAAQGGTPARTEVAKQGDYGWSPAYQEVLDLRMRFEAALKADERLRGILEKIEELTDTPVSLVPVWWRTGTIEDIGKRESQDDR